MVNPPKSGDESYELYSQEYNTIKDGLKKRADALYNAFQEMEGVELGEPQVSNLECRACLSLTINRAQCTCSQPYTYRKEQSRPPKKRVRSPMTSTASVCSMRLGSALCQDPGLAKSRTRCISGLPFWLQELSGLVDGQSSTKNSWTSIGDSPETGETRGAYLSATAVDELMSGGSWDLVKDVNLEAAWQLIVGVFGRNHVHINTVGHTAVAAPEAGSC